MNKMSEPNRLWRIFRIPLAIALSSAVGLIAALTGDGWLDVLSWMTLAVPPAIVLRALRRPGRSD